MVVRFRDLRRDGRCVYTIAVLQCEGGDLDGKGVKRAFIHWSLGIGGKALVNGQPGLAAVLWFSEIAYLRFRL